jgi:hypothetical protein
MNKVKMIFVSGCSKGDDKFLIRVEKEKLKHN